MSEPKKWGSTKDGKWVRLGLKTRKAIGCCDCGLVHWVTLRKSVNRYYVNFVRDQPLTEKIRARKEKG